MAPAPLPSLVFSGVTVVRVAELSCQPQPLESGDILFSIMDIRGEETVNPPASAEARSYRVRLARRDARP